MGRELRATVRVKQDELTGKQMIFPAESPPGAVVVYLEIDNRKCEITRDVECFSSGTGVSQPEKIIREILLIVCIHCSRLLDFWLLQLLVMLYQHLFLFTKQKASVLEVKFQLSNLGVVQR